MKEGCNISIVGFGATGTKVFRTHVFIDMHNDRRWRNKTLDRLMLEVNKHNNTAKAEPVVKALAQRRGLFNRFVIVASMEIEPFQEKGQ